jgi:signal transduction histidine kinase
MFARARLRLTVLFIALFALVIGAFSVIFYAAFATVLAPTFDIGPEVTNAQAAEIAYQATIDRIGLGLLIADAVAVGLVGILAWILASRTLRPIREAHLRQRRFVADASHEIRTPLAAIRATAEGALTGPAEPRDLQAALNAVAASADRLTHLTNDLLLLARTDERLLDHPSEPFDLSVTAAEAVETFHTGNPTTRTTRTILATDLRVSGDADDVGRIITNLLDNAYRYGGPGVDASLATIASEREAIVEIADNGPGMAATDLERIFEPFYRVGADAASPDGTGLGLALARSLAERNAGRLVADSEPGRGSTFRLILPRFR